MNEYQKQINDFIINGTYDYQLDAYGNLTIDQNNPSFSTKYFNVGFIIFPQLLL